MRDDGGDSGLVGACEMQHHRILSVDLFKKEYIRSGLAVALHAPDDTPAWQQKYSIQTSGCSKSAETCVVWSPATPSNWNHNLEKGPKDRNDPKHWNKLEPGENSIRT